MSYSSYHKLRALVVDDFESFRQTVGKMLQNFGIEDIDSADNGNMVLRWCEEKAYDVILCDYNLGRGRNGQQVLEELRYKNLLSRKNLFILVSAESSRTIILSSYDYEPDAYLAKPITGKSLKQRLDRLLVQRDEMLPIYKAIDMQKYEVAIEGLIKRIESGARNTALCQRLLGELYIKMSQFQSAEQVYREALEVRSLDWAKVGMAKVKRGMKEPDKAKRWLTDIIKKNPLCLQAYDELAEIHKSEGDGEALEEVLKKAVEFCPMAILRQERLAKAAAAVNDNVTAANAYRQTVRLGHNSCHNKRDNHINFGRTTASLLKEHDDAATDLSREAIKALEEIGNVFPQTEEESIQAMLVESQVLAGQGNKKKALQVVERAEKQLNSMDKVDSVNTEVDLVMALNASGLHEKADDVLQAMIRQHCNDQKALEVIDQLLEEPLSDNNRDKVSAVNKEGISHYDAQDYQEAINCFRNAQKHFPNHIGIRLNLVQALDGEMREYGYDTELMKLAKATISFVKGRINANHDQYDRYLQLQDMIHSIRRDS